MTTELSFVSIEWIKPLWKKLNKIWDQRDQEIMDIGNVFGDPRLLAKYYVEPNCQHHDPAGGIAIFAKAFFGHPCPTSGKNYATANAFGGPSPVVLFHSLHTEARLGIHLVAMFWVCGISGIAPELCHARVWMMSG